MGLNIDFQDRESNDTYCVSSKAGNSIKSLLCKFEPQHKNISETSVYVQELIVKGLPQFADGITSLAELHENKVYRIHEWTVCLVDKKPNRFHFTSIERHFEDGHLHFILNEEQIASKVVGPDDIFGTEADVIAFLEEEEEGELESGFSHDCCHGDNNSDGGGGGGGSETLDVEYWDDLFAESGNHPTEWLVTYSTIKTHVIPYIQPSDKILVVGCGNSDLSMGLYDDGFADITSMDISLVVVEQMKKKFADREGMQWDVEDVLEMTYSHDSFDIIMDKSLLDCVFHCSDAVMKVSNMVAEVHRVLRKGTGLALFLTVQTDDKVMPILKNPDYGVWVVEKINLKVETDCEGRVPQSAIAVIQDEEFNYAHSKEFGLYVCRAMSVDEESSKRQR